MAKLTVAMAREMPFEQLIQEADALIEQYSKPDDAETEAEMTARLERTLDELPDLYRWFLTLQSHFDHWTDAMNDQLGVKSTQYKSMRQRRDAMERMASAAKRRYEGASRLVTIRIAHDETGMPRGRG